MLDLLLFFLPFQKVDLNPIHMSYLFYLLNSSHWPGVFCSGVLFLPSVYFLRESQYPISFMTNFFPIFLYTICIIYFNPLYIWISLIIVCLTKKVTCHKLSKNILIIMTSVSIRYLNLWMKIFSAMVLSVNMTIKKNMVHDSIH